MLTQQVDLSAMKIKELPFSVIWELCRYLDTNNHWKILITRKPGVPYTVQDVDAFQRDSLRPNGSPAEMVIQDLIRQALTVDQLFVMLRSMGHAAAMRLLLDYVSPHLKSSADSPSSHHRGDDDDQPPPGGDNYDGASSSEDDRYCPSPPSPNIHPEFGPLPPEPMPPRQQQNTDEDSTPDSRDSTHSPAFSAKQDGSDFQATQKTASLKHSVYQLQHEVYSHSEAVLKHAGGYVVGSQPHGEENGIQTLTQNGIETLYVNGMGTFHAPIDPPSVYSRYKPGVGHANTPSNHHAIAPQRQASTSASDSTYPPMHTQMSYKSVGSSPPHSLGPNTPPGVKLPPSLQGKPPPAAVVVGEASPTAHGRPQVAPPPKPPLPPHSLPTRKPVNIVQPINQSTHQPHPHPVALPAPTQNGNLTPNIPHFSYTELSAATSGFTQEIVGIGSFGTVFKATVRGNGPFAIKRLHDQSEMEDSLFYEPFHQDTFTQELQLLTKYHHRNILSLVAYSNDGPRPCLVYEYMEYGSLADCLLGRMHVQLPWRLRLRIANQITDALHFLHTVNRPKCLVHGDVKGANILLDSHYTPKLSDFGLARECHARPNQRSTYSTQSNALMGTVAYMAPEFLRNRKLTPKTDVYSFGVVLLELYTGLAADDPTVEQRALTERLVHLFEDTETHRREIWTHADPRAAWPHDVGFDLFDIATVCLTGRPKDRPPMEQVRDQVRAISADNQTIPTFTSSPWQ